MPDSAKPKTIALVSPKRTAKGGSISDPFLLSFIGSLADALIKFDYQLLITTWQGDDHDWYPSLIESKRTEGIVVFGHSDFLHSIARLASSPAPFVVWGNTAIDANYCVVGSNNRQGGYLATEHLLKLGRRRIGFLGDYKAMEIDERWAGYKAALADFEVPYDEGLVARVMPYDYEIYDALYKQLVAKRVQFDALLASTDVIANFALRILRKINLRVPDDVAVAGFDNSSLAQLSNPPLTSVSQDVSFGARELTRQLMNIIGSQKTSTITLPVTLQERRSTLPDKPAQGLIKLNQLGAIQYIDSDCEQLLGYEQNEIIGRHIESIIPARKENGDSNTFNWVSFVNNAYKEGKAELEITTKKNKSLRTELWLAPLNHSPDNISDETDNITDLTLIITPKSERDKAGTAGQSKEENAHQGADKRISELLANAKNLERLAYRDGLTDIANRRYFDKKLSEEFAYAKHKALAITLIMIDIDYFKAYNDNHGHLAGDETLKAVAQCLSNTFANSNALVARYGGEEFSVVLTLDDDSEAQPLIHQALANIRDLKIPHEGSEIADIVTVSAGYCITTPLKNHTSDMLLWAADQGLYEAKHCGRNQAQLGTIQE